MHYFQKQMGTNTYKAPHSTSFNIHYYKILYHSVYAVFYHNNISVKHKPFNISNYNNNCLKTTIANYHQMKFSQTFSSIWLTKLNWTELYYINYMQHSHSCGTKSLS